MTLFILHVSHLCVGGGVGGGASYRHVSDTGGCLLHPFILRESQTALFVQLGPFGAF